MDKRLHNLNPVAVLFVTIVVLAIAIIFGRTLLPVLSTQNLSNEEIPTTLLHLSNSPIDMLGGMQLVLPPGWDISYNLLSPANTPYECVGGNTCQLAALSQSNAGSEITPVMLSYPLAVKFDWPGITNTSDFSFELLGESVMVRAEEYTVLSTEETGMSSRVTLYMQIYGCTSKHFCLQAGPFSTDPVINAAQVAEFREFARNVKLQ